VTHACAAVLARASAEPAVSTDALVAELCQRLGLDDIDEARQRGVPGGLLVLLARMRGQIDLPKLDRAAFCAALSRFGETDLPARARRSRTLFVRVAAIAAVVIGALLLGLYRNGADVVPVRQPDTVFVDTAKAVEAAAPPARRRSNGRAAADARPAPAKAKPSQPAAKPEERPKTVDMVNLPRSTWSVTR
jgi:hypothetical protein